MRCLKAGTLLVAALFLASCDDGEIIVNGPPGFSFRVEVKDIDSDRVEDIRVSAWNHISIDFSPMQKGSYREKAAHPPATMFSFSLASDATIDFSMYDLAGVLVERLIDSNLTAGAHAYEWYTTGQIPSGVYKCHLNAHDTLTNELLFEDFVYAVLWQPDPEVSVLGFTSTTGVYETHDSLLFPNVFDLPPMIHTSTDPTPLGTFSFRDTVTIWLTDTTTGKQQMFEKIVRRGTNNITLTWDPPAATARPVAGTQAEPSQRLINIKNVTSPLQEWRLDQNYPNPFN